MPEPCHLCKGRAGARVFQSNGWDLWECAECRLLAVNPLPSEEELQAFYERSSYRADARASGGDPRRLKRHLRVLERLPPGRLLDVGCGEGAFLRAAADAGWDAQGVERSPQAAEHARRVHGLHVHCGDLADLACEDASFDVVTLFDVIEHLRDPMDALRRVLRLLRPGGWLVLSTPNADGFAAQFTYWLFCRTIGAWDHATPPGHLFQFTRRTMRRALEQTGFAVERVETHHIGLAYSAGKLEESIVSALRPNPRAETDPAPEHESNASEPGPSSNAGSPSWPRLLVRGVCWGSLAPARVIAWAARRGDSMLVTARRPDHE